MNLNIRKGIVIDASPEEMGFLDARLELFNRRQTGRDDFSPLQRVVRDDGGSVIAGLNAVTGWGWLYSEKRTRRLRQ